MKVLLECYYKMDSSKWENWHHLFWCKVSFFTGPHDKKNLKCALSFLGSVLLLVWKYYHFLFSNQQWWSDYRHQSISGHFTPPMLLIDYEIDNRKSPKSLIHANNFRNSWFFSDLFLMSDLFPVTVSLCEMIMADDPTVGRSVLSLDGITDVLKASQNFIIWNIEFSIIFFIQVLCEIHENFGRFQFPMYALPFWLIWHEHVILAPVPSQEFICL
jgi:hypothetical protein